MDFIISVLERSIGQVFLSLLHNWPYLVASIVIAAVLAVSVDAKKVSAFLGRHRGAGVVTATAAAVTTPLCSCGTTAVVLGMMASTMPWAPIIAFMVSSPLSSPEGVVYTAGLFGLPFAIAMFIASVLLGLAGGAVATVLERRGVLANQARLTSTGTTAAAGGACPCAAEPSPRLSVTVPLAQPVLAVASVTATACGCGTSIDAIGGGARAAIAEAPRASAVRSRLARLPLEILNVSKRLLPLFIGFAFIGYVLNNLVPAAWVAALFGGGKIYGVPLAATLGLPLYISSEASLPMVRALLDAGMSQGAVMAFLIAGSGTSLGAIAGALTIARWRVIAVVVGVLWIGAMATGFAYNMLLSLKVIG